MRQEMDSGFGELLASLVKQLWNSEIKKVEASITYQDVPMVTKAYKAGINYRVDIIYMGSRSQSRKG